MFFRRKRKWKVTRDRVRLLGDLIRERASLVTESYKDNPNDVNRACAELMLGVMDDYSVSFVDLGVVLDETKSR